MNRELLLHDWLVAGIAVAAGALAGLVLRALMRWLGRHAERTRWNGDDLIVDALRTLVPWAAVIAGAAVAASTLPLTARVLGFVNQSLSAVLIIIATFGAARVVAGLVQSVAGSRTGVAGSASIFVNITRVVVLVMGVLVALETMGVSIAPLVTALGVGGLAVALALQDTLANLFAGVHILASKTVQPGDYIRLSSGEEGYVVDINWRNTVVRNLSNNLVIIPNNRLARTNMTNFTQPEQQLSILVQVGVGYESDLEHVERVTLDVVDSVMADINGAVPDHEGKVRFHTFADSRINFTVILGVGEFSDQYRIKHEFIKRLHERFRAEGISIPAPTRTVSLHHDGLQASALPPVPHQREAPPRSPAPTG
ncbi:mechanosensitive ion channel family protein [Streptomyces sp. NBC_01343]|uniref:Mechanosensitive ion channel family protein n=1 Tax=Streptomyces flavotricini TaxID=66888 RepID=A0ABS8DY82_9ACTN|nr:MULTISPECIES: mechanosensitive ion channel family protein [Streptomyces]MCC0093831.1 mechanosensitive ion channel family protein [Streptomyces flavotricini]WSI28187.1 mechanosensitive ion channel family protein [Streptomyces sp. NBC_01343]